MRRSAFLFIVAGLLLLVLALIGVMVLDTGLPPP
jgi:hypothetical protein